MKEAQHLYKLLVRNQLAINRFLQFAQIPDRNFYGWMLGDIPPSAQSLAKVIVATEVLEEYLQCTLKS